VSGAVASVVEDPGKTIDIRVKSLLVEKGGTLQAGSPGCPFGQQGGKLSIGLYGDDPSMQATKEKPPPGIQCQTAPRSPIQRCFPSNRDFQDGKYYCTANNSDDPCSSTTKPSTNPLNSLLENYGNLNFDPTPWGYKVLGVSYGGSLDLFGYKGAKPLQGQAGKDWATQFDSDTECTVPTAMESTLDTAEMKAWANLTGSSWVRLQDINTARTELTLDRLVSDWAAGDQIVVGTTDWYPSHSEARTIRSVKTVGMRTQLTVCRPVPGGTGPGGCPAMPAAADALDYPHFTGIFDAKTIDGAEYTEKLNRTAADLRATVGLLSRSIQIGSLGATAMEEFPAVRTDTKSCVFSGDTPPDHKADDCYVGGHTMVRQGSKEVRIQGVEFKQLGQGGRMGHYPVHFHLDKSTAYTQNKAFVKDGFLIAVKPLYE
jgi:G8 domain